MAINWSVRELDVFLALADTLSYSRAAERTHVSQPAVSGVIARLEESLNTRLFDRSTRAVFLTDAGAALLAHVRLLRNQVDIAVHAVHDVVELRTGRIRLAALPSLAVIVVPAALARFASEHPAVQFEVRDVLSGPAFDLVREGEVDFALTAANPAYADLEYTPLGCDHFTLLLPARHPLAADAGPLRWIDTVGLAHVSMPPPTSVRQYADTALLQSGHRFAPRYEVEHLATISAMVAAGLGVAALPELAAMVAPSDRVVQRRLVAPDMPRPIGLVTRRGRSLSPAAAVLVALLKQELERLTAPLRTLRSGSAARPPQRLPATVL